MLSPTVLQLVLAPTARDSHKNGSKFLVGGRGGEGVWLFVTR